MPRLFTALEIPAEIAETLSAYRSGLSGARWIDPENYHVTLRFIGDVDRPTAFDLLAVLSEARARAPVEVVIDSLAAFGGAKPRAIIARIAPSPALTRLQAEQERLAQRAGLPPEPRKYTPHVTLARLRHAGPSDVAGYIAARGQFRRLSFMANQVVLFSSRDSVGGGPYLIEETFPLGPVGRRAPHEDQAIMAWPPAP